jgi:hypothetical protein
MASVQTMKDELRKCIMDYVLQWQEERRGKATTAELAVMACVMSNEPVSIPEAMSWMRRHSHKSLDAPNNTSSSGSDQRRLPRPRCNSDATIIAQDGFDDEPVVEMVDRPEKPSHPPEEIDDSLADFSVPIYEFNRRGSQHWTSPTSSANVFLRRHLFPYRIVTPSSHFRIMDLPVEVREMIFEFTLLLPRSGVWYDFQTRQRGFGEQHLGLQAWTRDRDFVPSQYLPNTWNLHRDSPSAQPKASFRVDLKRHFALFRVSKQVHKEAFARYYAQNVFYLPNDYAFLKLFKHMSDAQFCHLGHIIWRWTKTEPPSEKYVQQFAALPRLRTLVIDAKEEEKDEFYYMYNWNRNAGLSIEDVSHLTAIKGLQKVVFFGPIAKHEQFLRSQMVGRKS